AIGEHAAVEDNDGQLFTGLLHGRRQGRRGVGRDDQHVAVAAGNQVGNVRDLLFVAAFCVYMDELFDLRMQINFRLHRRITDDAPRVVHTGVGETEGVGAFLGILGRIDPLRFQHLFPEPFADGGVDLAGRLQLELAQRAIILLLAEEFGLDLGRVAFQPRVRTDLFLSPSFLNRLVRRFRVIAYVLFDVGALVHDIILRIPATRSYGDQQRDQQGEYEPASVANISHENLSS